MAKAACPLMGQTSCSCTWYRNQHESDLFVRNAFRIQHGDNPEHSRIVTHSDQLNSVRCDQGHLIDVCRWALMVIQHAHPPGNGVASERPTASAKD